MRPGLPDPLIDLLGARWSMGAPVAAAAWFAAGDAAAFALADGTVAIARATWDGAARVQDRAGGGVELVPASAEPPPVIRVRVHAAPCADLAADGAAVLSGGLDGLLARVDAQGAVATLASFPGAPIGRVAAGAGGWACGAGPAVHRADEARLDLDGPALALAFGPDGSLAIGQRDRVTLWPAGAATGRDLACPGTHRALAWSADGRHLVSGLDEGGLRAWCLADGTDTALTGGEGKPLSLGIAPGGGSVAASGGGRVGVWPLQGGGARRECGPPSTARVTRVAWHPARGLLAVGYDNGAVLLCPPDSQDLLFVRSAGGGPVAALAWSPEGTHLAAAAAGGEVGVVAFPERLFRARVAAAEAGR